MENYKNVSQDIMDQSDAAAEAVQIILTGIDNDIYSTIDACLNACEMWKAIESIVRGGVCLEFALSNRILLRWCLKSRVLLWTVLIDSSLVLLTVLILIEVIALVTVLVVVLMSGLIKSWWANLV
nr:hypothetical protein [Tanacetum cinerariifolium]